MLTGVQRVAKESIFSKLNNIVVYTVLSEHYCQYFGLTSEETETLFAELPKMEALFAVKSVNCYTKR